MYIIEYCGNDIIEPENLIIGGIIYMDIAALVLVIIGALNWGSIGIFGVDAIGSLLGGQLSVLSRIIYTVVSVAGIWCITLLFRDKGATAHNHIR